MEGTPPAYRILTRRLILRCWEPTDAPELKRAVDANIEYLLPFMPWAAHEPTPLEDKIARIRKWRSNFDSDQDFTYGVFDRATGQALGGSGLHTRGGDRAREIGYWMDHAHWGQGLTTELAAALTKVGFEVDGLRFIGIHVDPANIASWSVAKKLGYTLEATLRRRLQQANGAIDDEMVWVLHAADYPNSPSAKAEIEAFDAAGRRLL